MLSYRMPISFGIEVYGGYFKRLIEIGSVLPYKSRFFFANA